MGIESTKFPVRSRDVKVTTLAAVFDIGATGAPTLNQGRGVTLSRSATGDYTATVSGTGTVRILHAEATLHVQSDLDRHIVGKGLTDASRTFAFTVLDGTQASATPIDPADGDTLTVFLVVRDSGNA